ncbi:MAG TPA: hypothetical protein VF665_05670 [Longimicrobium sp.]|jgi:hypothetical protein|uniref:hypothetical protein n=1 Tax=Longimicrobium sp. TaxID=2029185 RepID=UPI002EDB2FBF
MPCEAHPWKLIAPWWHWPRLNEAGRDVRATRPALQKYDSSDPVSVLIQDPQKSLAFGPEDVVFRTESDPAPTVGGKRTRFNDYVLVPTTTRKLFLPLHKRFYLVVCELHCDAPGLPAVSRDQVCEAGFVIRRRRLAFRTEDAPAAEELVRRAGSLATQIARIDRGTAKRVLSKRHRVTRGGVFGNAAGAVTAARSRLHQALDASAAEKRAELEAELAEVRTQLRAWQVKSGAHAFSEGWVPSDARNVGAWQFTDETPDEVTETVYPLYPLVPDPRNATHDAAGRTLYFGMLPMGGRETEADGTARFDEQQRLVIRCFVRRHRCECPRTGERNDCGGEVVWSQATEIFQMAAPFDPVGTGNQPVTIPMPDLRALAAAAQGGMRLPVAFSQPDGSSLNFSVDGDGEPVQTQPGGFQICHFSLPLITIVAYFVLNLFLPIVVFVFQLWFLLGLKFCIPPSISFGAGASLHAGLEGELGAEIAAAVDIDLEADIGILGAADLNLAFNADAGLVDESDLENPQLEAGAADYLGTRVAAAYSPGAVRSLQVAATADRSAELDGLDAVVYTERVQYAEVAA